MIKTLTRGQRARLASMGIDPRQVGRTYNRASVIPRNGDELAEMLADPTRSKDILKDTAALADFIASYAREQQGDGTDLNRMVAEETQRVFAQMLKDNDLSDKTADSIKRLNLDPQSRPTGMLTSHRQGTAYNPDAAGAILDKEFRNAAHFFRSVWHNNPDVENAARMAQLRNSFSSVVPSDGGFLVPEAFRAQLLQMALENSIVRPRATVVPMEVPRLAFPAIDVTSNATSVFGGMIAYWGEESAALTDASAKFEKIELDARKLTGFSLVPNELLADSPISFSALIEGLWPKALAWYEDVAYAKGSGVGEPLGFLANAATVVVGAESGQGTATILYENILKMISRLLPASFANSIWIASPDTMPQLGTMSLSVGTGGSAVFVSNAQGPYPQTLMGRPIIFTEKANQLGAQGDIALVDLSYYLIGDRQMMTATSSTDYRFGNDQTAFRIIQRVDGRPWIKSAITPQNGGPTLSPFVELAARP